MTAALYLVLLLFGLAQGVLGSFFYSAGPVPLAAIGFDLLLFATCLFGGWGTERPAGALMVAAGWLAATFTLALGTPAGSVVIVAGNAGQWFLFGGAASAAAGVVTAFVAWTRASARAAAERAAARRAQAADQMRGTGQ